MRASSLNSAVNSALDDAVALRSYAAQAVVLDTPGGCMVLQVMSGMLVAPRVPEPAERMEMASLVDTYE